MPAKRLTAAASWTKRKAIRTLLFCWQCVSYIFSLGFYLLAMCGFVLWLAMDFLPKKKSMSTPEPRRRKLPIPIREGGKVYAILPDDSRVEIEILTAASHARAWTECVTGVAVWEQTRVRPSKQPDASNRGG